jgi:hypothetical protein
MRWLTLHARRRTARLEVAAPTEEIRSRLFGATKAPPGKSTAGDLPQASRGEAFVSGGFLDEGTAFTFTGYRERQWVQPALDPDLILKPRLRGEIESDGSGTTVVYQVDARASSRTFFVLVALATLFVLVGAVLALVFGVPVPGPAFFLFVIAGVCVVFANGIWRTVPKAQEDEAFLEQWLQGVLN